MIKKVAIRVKTDRVSLPPNSIPKAIPGFSMNVNLKKSPIKFILEPRVIPSILIPSEGILIPLTFSLVSWSIITTIREI